MAASLTEFIGTLCEITTQNSDLLCIGRLKSESGSEMEVSAVPGESLPLVYCNTAVHIVFHSPKFYIVRGRVFIANDQFIRITGLEVLKSAEQRGNFRVRVGSSMQGILTYSGMTMGKVRIIDVGLFGAQILCKTELAVGSLIRLSDLALVPEMPPFSFNARVRWQKPHPDNGGAYYGVQFEGMPEKQTDDLCKALFALQREAIRKMKSRR